MRRFAIPTIVSLTLLTLALVLATNLLVDTHPVSASEGYRSEDVSFVSADATIAGTLTIPNTPGPHPAVVLMSGSGPQDRNEEIFPGFQIFGIIADYLSKRGIAVLRYDDRGVGASTGSYAAASLSTFAFDAKGAVAYLRTRPEIDREQVGLFGHSEGGLYAAMIAADPSTRIAFIASMAGPAVDGKALLLDQNRQIFETAGAPPELVASQLRFLERIFPLVEADRWDEVEQAAYDVALEQWEFIPPEERGAIGVDAETSASLTAQSVRGSYAGPWFSSFLRYDPAPDWKRTTVPVLAVYGAKDVQVDDDLNAGPLIEALSFAPTNDYAVVVLPDANHLFQAAGTGNIDEYLLLDPQFTPDFLPTVGDWLLRHVRIAP